MAAGGNAPRRGAVGRNRKPARGDWTQLDPLDQPVLMPLDEIDLPVLCEESGWPYTARKYWDSWRISPVTAKWTEDDIALAIDTISQFAATTRMVKGSGGVPLAASEMRLRMESLGLTPEGRRKGRYLLPEEDTPEEEPHESGTDGGRKLPEAV